MKKRLQADKDRLVLELEEVKEKMVKEKKRFELYWRENQVREAQTREKMEALLKERDEMSRRYQADKDSLILQLDEERRNTEKEIERFEKRQELTEGSWRKHCEVLEHIILEEKTELKKMTKEVEDLKETVEELKQKARYMDPEMKEGLKGVEKRLKNFGPRWLQKLQMRNNIKRRQYLEKEIKRLELQLRNSKAREARSTEVINVLVKERVKMKRQLELGLIIFQTSLYTRPEGQELMESKQKEFNSTKVINALVKEREEMKKELHKEKERMVLELDKVRKNMEKEKGQETFELLKRERGHGRVSGGKMIELRRMFQAEMERVEKKISEMANLQEMTEEPEASEPNKEAGEKEGHETDDKKLKHVSIPCSKKHRKKKKQKKATKVSQQMEKEQESESEAKEDQMRREALVD
ncbi:trichohyalin-like [Tachysurus fulvidraco]|uniref:trichohyalin-like n=1 Tax=Tachysurus fulvidraco TaxID=1234273 RepID=UPI000F4ED6CD|nr:trichohyalin-like [Tachysurus fulvidraco]